MNKRKADIELEPVEIQDSEPERPKTRHSGLPEQEPQLPESQLPESQELRKKRRSKKKRKRGAMESMQIGENSLEALTKAMFKFHGHGHITDEEEFSLTKIETLTTINFTSGPCASPRRQRQSAQVTLQHNDYLSSLNVSESELISIQQIQATYKMEVKDISSQSCRLTLIWDYDRLWGSFDIGVWKGVMLIEPGPRDNTPNTYRFTWRGRSEKSPEVNIDNPKVTTGAIVLGGTGSIRGCFNGMVEGLCEFTATRQTGHPVVPWPVEEFINDWNILSADKGQEPESPRLVLMPLACGSESQPLNEDEPSQLLEDSECHSEIQDTGPMNRSSPVREETTPPNKSNSNKVDAPTVHHPLPSPAPSSWTPERQENFLQSVTGSYDIQSPTIKDNWSRYATQLALHIHIDKDDQCVWGMFDMGICSGFMLFQNSPDDIVRDQKLMFRWRGRDSFCSKNSMEKTGYLYMASNLSLQGVFHSMYGDVCFAGHRKEFPKNGSGYEVRYYQHLWREYEPSA